MYDLCVVGAGMIGTAAAKHASMNPNVKVCLIGPSEPKVFNLLDGTHKQTIKFCLDYNRGTLTPLINIDHVIKTSTSTRDIFGAYYDEGRITRSCDPDPVWAHLARESIKRYRDIEIQSGISFYQVTGCLMIGPQNSDYLQNVRNTAQNQNVAIEELNRKKLSDNFPYLNLDEHAVGVFEKDIAGHISPRKLVEAQKVIAKQHGCDIVDDVVKSVTRAPQRDGSYIMTVLTEGGKTINSKAVLLTTGSYTTFRKLMPGIQPKQNLFGLTVALVEVDTEYLEKLKNMPVVLCKDHPNPNSSEKQRKVSFYLLPPIQYPDGRFYLKLGRAHECRPVPLNTGAEVREWFIRGDHEAVEITANLIASLFKGLNLNSWRGDYCVIMETTTTRPYIDTVHAQLGVAIGGNGYAAKSSDEIGRLASEMMMSGWNSSLSRDIFKLVLNEENTSNLSIDYKSKL